MDDSATVLIPKHTTNAIIIILTSVHEQIFHCGVESTLARLIQRFWMPLPRLQGCNCIVIVLSAEEIMDRRIVDYTGTISVRHIGEENSGMDQADLHSTSNGQRSHRKDFK